MAGGAESRRKLYHPESGIYARDGGPEAPRTSEHTILVVDDEPMFRAFIARALKGTGFGVVEADCAERAMEVLQTNQHTIALLLTDVGCLAHLVPSSFGERAC